jgi:hypothetical protein
VAQGTPGRFQNGRGAQHALRVRGAQARGCVRIARGELAIKGERADLIESRADTLTDLRWNRWYRRQALREDIEVKARSSDEDRNATIGTHAFECSARIVLIAANRITVRHRHVAVKQMRRALLVFDRRPRRQNTQLAIDLHGVGIDHGAADALGQRKRERRLAARGRPCNKHGVPRHWIAITTWPRLFHSC